MEDITCMSLHEKFPWLKTFCNKFSKGYLDEQDLLKNLKDELNGVSTLGKKRKKELFEVIKSLFLHFWWRMRWKQACTWKKYWKTEGKMVIRSNDGCKLIAKLLEFVIYLGILLSKGNINSPWITNIMRVVGILPDCDDIVCTSLLSLSVKKKYRSSLIAVLKNILISNIPQYIKEPLTFIKIMMLFKKWKMLTSDTNERILIKKSANKFLAPPCLISLMSSFSLDGSKVRKNKVSQLLLKKSSKGLLKNLKLVIEDQESFSAKQSKHKDNYKLMDSTSAFHYISEYISDFEDSLKKDVLENLYYQNKGWTLDESSITGISANSTTCDKNASVQNCLVDSESVYPFIDEATHESEILRNQQEACLKKSVKIENSINHRNIKDLPSYISSVGFENSVDKKETVAKTNQKGKKTNLGSKISIKLRKLKDNECLEYVPVTSTPKVDSADICSFEDLSMENESDSLSFRMGLAEKFPDSYEIIDENNQKKRKKEYDKNTSIKKLARKKDLYTSDSLSSISPPSSFEDSNQDSLLICDPNNVDETAVCQSVSNTREISKIKKDNVFIQKRRRKSSSENTLQNTDSENNLVPSNISKNATKCDKLKKSGKFVMNVEADKKKPVPVNVKRHKLYNPDVLDNYKLPETESGSDSSTLDFTVENKQHNSPDDLSLYDGQSPLLFASGSEFGLSDVFPKPSGILLDYCFSEVEQQEIAEKEASEEEIARRVLNSVIGKVSSYSDNADVASVTTNNLNIYLDKICHDPQLDLTLEKLSQELNDIIPYISHVSTNSSVTDNNRSGPSDESSFSNYPLPKNVRAENFQPSSSCTSSSFASNNSQWCASLHQNTLTINCNLSEIGSNGSQININPMDSLIPLNIVINLNSHQHNLSQRQCSETNFPSTLPRNNSSNNFIHFHGSYCNTTSMSRPSDDKNKACSPTSLLNIKSQRQDDQPTEYTFTQTFSKSSSNMPTSTQEAVIHSCDTFSKKSTSEYNENTFDNQILNPLLERSEVDGNQGEVLRESSNLSSSLSYSSSNELVTSKCNEGIYIPDDESEVTNSVTVREDYRSRLRNKSHKPDYTEVFQVSEVGTQDDELESVTNVSSINAPVSTDSCSEHHSLIKWLTEKYETFEKSELSLSTVRHHYLKFCKDHRLNPVNREKISKLIQSVFHGSSVTRRGLRGSYRYYYKSLRVKPTCSLDHKSSSRLKKRTSN